LWKCPARPAQGNIYLADNVNPVALKKLVFFFLHQHNKIARRTAVEPAIALAGTER